MGKVLFLRKGSVHTVPQAGLPSGYTKLAYIQSTGTQYVDTGFKPNQDSRIVIDEQLLAVTTNQSIFGSRAGGTKCFWVFTAANSSLAYAYGSSTSSHACTLSDRLLIDANKNILSLNGSAFVSPLEETFNCSGNLYLCAVNNNGTLQYAAQMKLYSCQIYDNGTLVRDFLPCINASGAVGLYDLVGRQFYGNSGTGVFTGSEVE